MKIILVTLLIWSSQLSLADSRIISESIDEIEVNKSDINCRNNGPYDWGGILVVDLGDYTQLNHGDLAVLSKAQLDDCSWLIQLPATLKVPIKTQLGLYEPNNSNESSQIWERVTITFGDRVYSTRAAILYK